MYAKTPCAFPPLLLTCWLPLQSFETYFEQGLRYVSDRTGIISFANFPIIWLFGMRNNVAMWLTGWDFGTYNNFHRWTARIATVQAIVHSIGYTILVLKGKRQLVVFQYADSGLTICAKTAGVLSGQNFSNSTG